MPHTQQKPLWTAVGWFLAIAFVVAACSTSAAEETPQPPHPTTVTTTTETVGTTAVVTTTTEGLASMTVGGAPSELATAVESIYEFAAGASTSISSAVPSGLHPESGIRAAMAGRTAATTVVEGDGYSLAVVVAGNDTLGAIDDGTGWRIIGGWLPTLDVGPWFRADPAVVAVVGSDARPGQSVTGSRADSIHLVAISNNSAAILGIPRDSWVPINGGGNGKINSSLAGGGPDGLMRTLEDTTNLSLDGYVITGFVGFQELVGNVMTGIDIDLPYGLADRASGAYFSSGPQYMNGPQALAFSRARKTLAGGDLERQRNGGRVLLAALETAGLWGATALPGFIVGAESWLETDLDPGELLGLFLNALAVDSSEIANEVAPGFATTRGSASVVVLGDSAPEMFSDLEDAELETQNK